MTVALRFFIVVYSLHTLGDVGTDLFVVIDHVQDVVAGWQVVLVPETVNVLALWSFKCFG